MNGTIERHDQAIKELKLVIAKKDREIESAITQIEHHKEKMKLESETKQKAKFPTTSTVNPYITRSELVSKLHNINMRKKSDLKKMKNRLNMLIVKRKTIEQKLHRQGIPVPEIASEPVEVPTINLCSNCECPIDFNSNNCAYCGKVFESMGGGLQVSSSCPKCKSPIDLKQKVKFCPYCGTTLE